MEETTTKVTISEFPEYLEINDGTDDGEDEKSADLAEAVAISKISTTTMNPSEYLQFSNVDSDHITASHIKEICYELSLITLCWPPIEAPVFEQRTQFPESYYKNSAKEKLTLLHVENFRLQYIHNYPKRRHLVLAADNECGIQKFVCNTIRPTNLPYLELKPWKDCAQFVADNIRYEALERPTIVPERIIGPNTCFQRQLGTCFEIAICLCSLLIGNGYDAYVCFGYATQDTTENVRYRTICPVKANYYEKEEETKVEQQMKYQLRQPRDLRSKFLLGQEQKIKDKIAAENFAAEEAIRLEREEHEKAPFDPLHGWRIHAWVLLLPKREITAPIFVEPSNGESHELTTTNYTSLDCVFNHENYWVNIQEGVKFDTMSFDLTNINYWEHMFMGEPIDKRNLVVNPDVDADENINMDEKHLDAPTPWSDAIEIEHSMLTQRFPHGCRTTHYKRTILQQYGDYVTTDGLKFRLSHYSDFECTAIHTIEDSYENRMDGLIAIKTQIEKNERTEYFKRGREDACRIHIYDYDFNTLEMPRTMEFFNDSRLDGLKTLEADALFFKEYFVNREDNLNFRHTTFAPRGHPPSGFIEGARRIIVNIVEKFNRQESIDAHNDVAIREFAIADNEIHIKYHYAKGHVTASTRDFIKPSLAEMGDELIFNPNQTTGYQAEIGSKPPKQIDLFYQLKYLLKEEQRSLHLIRDREDEIQQFIRTRSMECTIPKLEVSLFNRELNEDFKIGLQEKEQKEREMANREVDENIDFITPYICRLGQPKELDVYQAHQVRLDCVDEFKTLLLERANKLRSEFELLYDNYQSRQEWFAHNVSQLDIADEEFELKNLALIKYQLTLFDIRLQRHKELSVSRFNSLINYLDNDPRMANFKISMLHYLQ